MSTETETSNTITIDATGKRLGRLASEVASLLQGKHLTSFARNVVADVRVHVSNVDKLDIPEKKLAEKEYQRYSGFPGGRKTRTMAEVIAKKGHAEVVRLAVYNMLPANRLRKPRLKNLIIT